jgi:transposase
VRRKSRMAGGRRVGLQQSEHFSLLTDLRKRAIASIQDGQSPKEVARVLGIDVATVFGWLARYGDGGWTSNA